MAITSENNPISSRGYSSSHFRYAMTYVVVTLVVLILLNIYCSNISQMVFYQSKEASMLSKCQLAADEIAGLEVINSSTISSVLSDMDSLKVSRLIVTDQAGRVLFDNLSTPRNQYFRLSQTR